MSSDLDKVFRLKDDKDWVLWKFQISILLKYHEVYEYATGEKKKPKESAKPEEFSTFHKGDITAQRAIMSTIDREPMLYIVTCKTAARCGLNCEVCMKRNRKRVCIICSKSFSRM